MVELVDFFDTNTFIGVVTLIVGSVAFAVYGLQKRDFKKGIASIVLIELRNAEQIALSVKNRGIGSQMNQNDEFLLPNNSWSKHNYLFIDDFDTDEWLSINNFINLCTLYDGVLKHFKEDVPYQLRQKEKYIQKALVEIAKEHKYGSKEYLKKAETLKNSVVSEAYTFLPAYHDTEHSKILLNIDTSITTSSLGTKLKKISKKRKWLFF